MPWGGAALECRAPTGGDAVAHQRTAATQAAAREEVGEGQFEAVVVDKKAIVHGLDDAAQLSWKRAAQPVVLKGQRAQAEELSDLRGQRATPDVDRGWE